MTIETIEIAQGKESDNSLEVTFRGETAAVVKALIDGLPRAALEQLHEALSAEMARRGKGDVNA